MNDSMEEEALTLEKINADRITKLEEKIDRRFEVFDHKIDTILTKIGQSNTSSGGNGNSYVIKSVGLVFTILIPMLTASFIGFQGQMDDMKKDIQESAVKDNKSIEDRARVDALLHSEIQRLTSVEGRVENFKQERARINDLEKNVARQQESIDNIRKDMGGQDGKRSNQFD